MKQGWEIKKLGEVATYVNGYAFKPEHWGETGMPIIRIQNLNNPNAEYNYCDADIPEKFVVENGDILISWSASLGVYEWNRGKAYLNQHIFKVVFNKVEINKYFLKYAVNAKLNDMLKDAHGATMKHIVKGDFDNTIIPYPPREEQERIVAELDCLSSVIENKREQLKELDALAQSIFYQMFGDPITNEKGWEVKKLKNITSKIGSGATPKGGNESYKDEGISLIRSLNVHNNLFVYKDLAHIDDEQADALKNVVVEDGDVLLNITGASVARCCVVPNDVLPARVNQHVAIIRPKELGNNIFICYQFTSNAYQQELLSIGKSNGATREALTKGQLEELDIIMPPLALQQEFADKIEAIEKQKELIKKSISETENLFNARMEYYFN